MEEELEQEVTGYGQLQVRAGVDSVEPVATDQNMLEPVGTNLNQGEPVRTGVKGHVPLSYFG